LFLNCGSLQTTKFRTVTGTNYLKLKNVLITGGSGLLGERLTDILLQRGYHVAHLGRAKHKNKVPTFIWDVDRRYIDPEAFRDVETIIHLAGAGIADKRWTENRKREIRDSRVNSTRLLYDELKKGGHSVKRFISASAIGYYGFDNDDEFFDEDDDAGKDFLARVTLDWGKRS
jgi:NAD dependent epimerase/dehydratase family enzyme